ncbi:MAG: hypothetical protein AAGF67_13135, partial [Verrucomicrobiota bacterium]
TVSNPDTYLEKEAEWTIFAEYLHEPIGITFHDGWLYAVQRPEVTRMKDTTGDGRADVFETVADDWGIKGNYHEYNFGSRIDPEGNLYVSMCLTGSFSGESLFRGWTVKIDREGKMTPFACGIRSPGGIGYNASGDLFYTDNQGAWNGSSSLKWLKPGSFQGNPNGNVYFPFTNGEIGERPPEPDYSKDSRIVEAMERIPTLVPPAVVLPHGRVGASPTGIEPDLSGGKFGPFAGQTFVGEQTHSKVNRVFLEKVNGYYQGAVFPFLRGFRSGNIGLLLTKDGKMYTGGSNRGWGAQGPSNDSFERVDWTGETPFEIHEMRIQPDGFELTFTKPIDPASAVDASFACEAFTYRYSKAYGGAEEDLANPTVTVLSVAEDGMSLRVKLDSLIRGHVHHLEADGIRSAEGKPLLHPEAYYTVNEIPAPQVAGQ